MTPVEEVIDDYFLTPASFPFRKEAIILIQINNKITSSNKHTFFNGKSLAYTNASLTTINVMENRYLEMVMDRTKSPWLLRNLQRAGFDFFNFY